MTGGDRPSVAAALRGSWPQLGALALLSLANNGLEIGTRNHVIQIPVVWKTLDPELYAATSYGETLSRYYSLYWVIVAAGAARFGISATLIVAHVVSRLVLVCGTFVLGYSLFGTRRVALTAVLLTVFNLQSVLATHVSFADRTPTHTVLALALTVWALLFLWERRVLACALVTGLICQVNLMNGTLLVFVFAVAILFDRRSFGGGRLVAALAGWLVISASALRWALETPAPDVDLPTYAGALRRFFPYHFFPLEWGPGVWRGLAGLIVVLALCLAHERALPRRRIVLGTLAGVALTWTVAVVVSVVPRLQPLVLLQWGRTCAVLVILLVPCVAYYAAEVVPARDPVRAMLSAAALVAAWRLAHGTRSALVVLAVCLVAMIAKGTSTRLGRLRAPFDLGLRVAAIATSAVIVVELGRAAWRNGVTPRTQPESWIGIQEWARASTPKDAVFLTLPGSVGFRVHSRRDVYFSEKNRDALMISPNHASEVLRKERQMEALGLAGPTPAAVSWPRLAGFCRDEGIGHVVLPSSVRVAAEAVHRSSDWSVYEVPPPAGRGRNGTPAGAARPRQGEEPAPGDVPAPGSRPATGGSPVPGPLTWRAIALARTSPARR